MSQILLPWQRGSLWEKFAWHHSMAYSKTYVSGELTTSSASWETLTACSMSNVFAFSWLWVRSTCCIWLDIWRRFKSLLSCSMFESTSSWGSTAPDKVWMQLSQKQYPMYRILWMLGFHLQQQNKPTRDKWRGRRLMSTAKTTSLYHVTFAFFSFIKWLHNN